MINISHKDNWQACLLKTRKLLLLRGKDSVEFLQPLVSNDLAPLQNQQAVWAGQLTPQGKFSHDLLIARFGDFVILETQADVCAELRDHLLSYRLSADVEFAMADEFKVWGLVSDSGEVVSDACESYGYGLCFSDPRHSSESLGYRFWGRAEDFVIFADSVGGLAESEDSNAYHVRRIGLFIPENSCLGYDDLFRGRSLLLEAGFDELGGIDWSKGCYVGQELTARTKYRGLVKRCLVGVSSSVEFAVDSICGAGGDILGDIRSRGVRSDGVFVGLAGMRLGDLGGRIFCGGVELSLHVPSFIEHRGI